MTIKVKKFSQVEWELRLYGPTGAYYLEATEDDLLAAGFVRAKLYAAENEADPKGCLRATVDNYQREWDRMIQERDNALAEECRAKEERDAALLRIQELEKDLELEKTDQMHNGKFCVWHPQWVEARRECDAALARVKELEVATFSGCVNVAVSHWEKACAAIVERDELSGRVRELEAIAARSDREFRSALELMRERDELRAKLESAERELHLRDIERRQAEHAAKDWHATAQRLLDESKELREKLEKANEQIGTIAHADLDSKKELRQTKEKLTAAEKLIEELKSERGDEAFVRHHLSVICARDAAEERAEELENLADNYAFDLDNARIERDQLRERAEEVEASLARSRQDVTHLLSKFPEGNWGKAPTEPGFIGALISRAEAAERERDAMRPVVEAAKAIRKMHDMPVYEYDGETWDVCLDLLKPLLAAVDELK